MKIFYKLLLMCVLLWALPVQAAYQPNYINEMSQYAVWKNSKRISIWVQPCQYKSTVYNAFREWVAASGGCIRFVEANSEKTANIKVYFVPKLDGEKAGVTYPWSYGKYMTKAEIQIRYTRLYKYVKDPKSKYNKYTVTKSNVLTNDEIYAIAVHEIGHALGIHGHSSNRNDIMFPTTDTIGIHASDRDVNTIREFYCSGKY